MSKIARSYEYIIDVIKMHSTKKSKKHRFRILFRVVLVLVLFVIICAGCNSFCLRMWLQNQYDINSDVVSLLEITTHEKRAYELIESKTEQGEKAVLIKIRKNFPYSNTIMINDILFVDLIDKQNNRRILCKKNGEFYKYIKIGNVVWTNISNKTVSTFEIPQELINKNEHAELKALDPFRENERGFQTLPVRIKDYKWVSIDFLQKNKMFDKQKLSFYENTFNCHVLAETGKVFSKKTSFAVVALAQDLEMNSLYNGLLDVKIGINEQGQIVENIFFCMYKKLEYMTGMYFTITNPFSPYNGCEVLICDLIDNNVVELSYKTPYAINTFADITAIKYLEKSNQLKYCNDYYESLAVKIFEQMLNEYSDFEIWSEFSKSELVG